VERTYGPVAKLLHWATAALLVVQYLVGWMMPDIRHGMTPGIAMNLHMSFGICLLTIVLIRYAWRVANPVLPEASLPASQRTTSGVVHLVLYALLLVTMIAGWAFASMRGWTIAVFGIVPLTSLVAENSEIGRAIGRLHGVFTWMLLVAIAAHVFAALVHTFVYRDRVMQRMLPSVGTSSKR
jgi:cytochrome b561